MKKFFGKFSTAGKVLIAGLGAGAGFLLSPEGAHFANQVIVPYLGNHPRVLAGVVIAKGILAALNLEKK